MICRSPAGMAFTGFREGVDYIHLETLNELEGINRYLEDEDGLERMAISARNIVLRYHTLHARVAQLNEAINKSSGNAFNGAEWHSGDILFL
jgi:spore maturation protein CgeB